MNQDRLAAAQRFLQASDLDGWLLYDFRHGNPIFWQMLGPPRHTTRRVYLLIPREGEPRFLAHRIDVGALAPFGVVTQSYVTWQDLESALPAFLGGATRLAMEYSPGCVLPVVSRVDAGTVELVRSLGVEVVSSADLMQFTIARWTDAEIASHHRAAGHLEAILARTFDFIRGRLDTGVTELDTVQFMRQEFDAVGLETEDGPIVAVNAHSGDPHYEPTPQTSSPIRPGDWLLIDFWAREKGDHSVYADITWVSYVGREVPDQYRRVFDVVVAARDRAIDFIADAVSRSETPRGWQVDAAARDVIVAAGLGDFFTHRLGHSLGRTVHYSGVNLDNFETRDHRALVPGVAVTVEPGVYLPEFGVRSEVNVLMSDAGPLVTTPRQQEVTCLTR
ncbi:MAG TPA: M24 family metallopeptidase [Chloroflexota bacterium]|nr:M24 family metallopeptidase [Chloroflexota bacterium]